MKSLLNKTLIVICTILTMNNGLFAASNDSEIIRELINHRLVTEKNAVGVSIAIIENNEVEYLNLGLSDKKNNQATTADTLFEIGSISKTFTSLALASMVKEGKVKLTDPIQKYLPKQVTVPTRAEQKITLLSLSNHTSSLPRLPNNMPFGDPLDPYADYTVEMMYEFLNTYELKRDIGEKVEYSNLGTGLLGHVLGLIDNKTYQQVITDRVLTPLTMYSTFVDVPKSELKRLSDGHDTALKKTKHWQIPTLAAAGAIKSNISDMALYLKANLNQQPLNESIALTHKLTINSAEIGPKIGLAWFIAEHENGSYIWHNGGTGGFRSFIGFDKTKNKGIVILENTTNDMDAIARAYLSGTLAQLKSDTFDVVIVEEQKLRRLNGQYELAPNFIMTVSNQANQLFIQATGQSNLPVTSKSELEFVNLAAQAKITFALDDKGEAVSLTLHQGGRSQLAPKLSPESLIAKKEQVKLTELELDNLIGVFQLMPNFSITTSHDNGQLVIQATGQPKIPFETTSKTEFFNAMVQAKLTFELDNDGKATSLTLLQAGQELIGTKK